MRVLVIDSAGVIGHVVAMYFREKGHQITGYSEAQSDIVNTILGCLTDTDKLNKIVRGGNYDVVINCSAVINQNAERNKTDAVLVNSYLPHFLEKITAESDTVIVHRSTDCVFSGARGQYILDDTPDAVSFYAKTKAVGELINNKDITIRTSLVGPDYRQGGEDLFNWFYKCTGNVNGYANAIWTGLTTIEFAHEIEILLHQRAHGLFHLVPDYAISKFELLVMFEKYFPADRNIVRVDNQRIDKSLVQAVNGYDIKIPDYERMISEMAEWIRVHGDLYANYSI